MRIGGHTAKAKAEHLALQAVIGERRGDRLARALGHREALRLRLRAERRAGEREVQGRGGRRGGLGGGRLARAWRCTSLTEQDLLAPSTCAGPSTTPSRSRSRSLTLTS